MRRPRGFTLIELLVVISIIALLIAVLLPTLGAARQSARALQNATQIRGMHQGFNVYAHANKGFYPGIDRLDLGSPNNTFTDAQAIDTVQGNSRRAGMSTTARIAIALEDELFTAEYAHSPAETNDDVVLWERSQAYAAVGSPTSVDHISSYAISQLIASGVAAGRSREWRDNANAQAVVMGDRMTGGAFDRIETYRSLWTGNSKAWNGSLIYNDGHAVISNDAELKGTIYGGYRNEKPDNIYLGLNDLNAPRYGGAGTKDTNCDIVPGNGWINSLMN